MSGEGSLLGGPRQLSVSEPLVEVRLREGTVFTLVSQQPLQRRLQDEAVGKVPRLLLVQSVEGPQGDGLKYVLRIIKQWKKRTSLAIFWLMYS